MYIYIYKSTNNRCVHILSCRCARGETKPGGNKDDSDTERKQVSLFLYISKFQKTCKLLLHLLIASNLASRHL